MAALKLQKLRNHPRIYRILVPVLIISIIAGVGSYLVFTSKAAESDKPFEYKIASYNVLGAGANFASDFNDMRGTDTLQRAKHATNVMRNFDVIGVQELDFYKEKKFNKNQFGMFKAELQSAYSMYPQNSPTSTNKSQKFDNESLRAIFWKKDRFNLVGTGSVRYPYQDAPRKDNGEFELNDKAPWVLLEDKTDPRVKFYVLNIHMVAFNNDRCRWDCNPPNERGGSDTPGDQKRKAAAHIVRDWIAEKKGKFPVLLTGDMNSSYTLRKSNDNRPRPVVERSTGLPYCVLGNNAVIRNTMDIHLKLAGQCPSNDPNNWQLDHVYATEDFIIKKWGKFVDANTKKASDHKPTFARVSLLPPGAVDPNDEPADPTESYESDPLSLLDD